MIWLACEHLNVFLNVNGWMLYEMDELQMMQNEVDNT